MTRHRLPVPWLLLTLLHLFCHPAPTWNPRSTGNPLLVSVSVCPPQLASLSNSVTLAPFLRAGQHGRGGQPQVDVSMWAPRAAPHGEHPPAPAVLRAGDAHGPATCPIWRIAPAEHAVWLGAPAGAEGLVRAAGRTCAAARRRSGRKYRIPRPPRACPPSRTRAEGAPLPQTAPARARPPMPSGDASVDHL